MFGSVRANSSAILPRCVFIDGGGPPVHTPTHITG